MLDLFYQYIVLIEHPIVSVTKDKHHYRNTYIATAIKHIKSIACVYMNVQHLQEGLLNQSLQEHPGKTMLI